jgi:hypothetical protein
MESVNAFKHLPERLLVYDDLCEPQQQPAREQHQRRPDHDGLDLDAAPSQ